MQRIVTGGVLAGIAFVVSGGLELKLAVSISFPFSISHTNIYIIHIYILAIISQKTYPVLPESGMMHVSVYNGLVSLNSSLSCSGFENEVVITNPNGEVGNITVKDPIQELFIPQNAYRIDDVTYSCEDGSINFEKKTFDPPQTVGYTFPNTFLVIKLTCVIYL